jgi:hypothetical protein
MCFNNRNSTYQFGLAAVALGLLIACHLGAAPPAGGLRVADGSEAVSIFEGDRLLLEYRFAAVPFKPYARQLFSPSGVNVLRDSPEDHKHHHGLMYAIAVNGTDFWAEPATAGRQIHREISQTGSSVRDTLAKAWLVEKIDWAASSGEIVLEESRRIELTRERGNGASLLTWKSHLQPPLKKQAVLSGSHYFGLGMRFPVSMERAATFVFADDKSPSEVVRGDERLTKATWCAAFGKVDGKEVTVAMFGNPANQRGATKWFTMADSFAYLSGTINLWREPLTLTDGQVLDLCYGVAVWDGRAESKTIDKLYRQWVDSLK